MTVVPKRVFILLGPPGVGKGTQAQHLAKNYQLLHIDTGKALRAEIQSSSPVGITAKSYVDSGQLVPSDVVVDVIEAAMQKIPADKKGYLLDGFPRNIQQAEGLKKILQSLQVQLNAVISLVIPREALMDRLAFRVTCEKCDTKYNTKLNPPKTPGLCDTCGGALVTRPDDRPEVIQNRLDTYDNETDPLIAYYQQENVLKSIDAGQSISKVSSDIKQQLDPFFSLSDAVAP
jgi:adenylate kinase